jgi:hypothetical protein
MGVKGKMIRGGPKHWIPGKLWYVAPERCTRIKEKAKTAKGEAPGIADRSCH